MGSPEGIRPHARAWERAKKLIQAVVDCAQGAGNPPPELEMYWLCKRFPGALPEAGALYDQPAGLMYRMAAMDNVYRAVSRYRNAVGKQIHQLTNEERSILGPLLREGML